MKVGTLLMAGLLSAASVGIFGNSVSAQDDAVVEVSEAETGQVNLNEASEEELSTLPGIGPSKAQAIMAYRERRPFGRIEHLMRVRGIGRATFRRLRPMIRVE